MQTNYVGEIADRQTDSGERRGRGNCSSRQTSVRPHVLIKRIHLTLLTARAAEKFEPLRGGGGRKGDSCCMCHSASVRWPTRQCLQCLLTRLLILCNYSNFELKTYSGCCLCCYFCCWCWCFSSRASLAGWHTAEQTEGRTETWRLSASALPSWHVTTHKPLDRRASSASTWTLLCAALSCQLRLSSVIVH